MCTTLTATIRSKLTAAASPVPDRVLGRMCGLITKNFALPRTQSKRFEIMQPDSQGLLIVYENLWSPPSPWQLVRPAAGRWRAVTSRPRQSCP